MASNQIDKIFAQLPDVDRMSLAALPYRIGLYVSYADVTGGWEAQEREQETLSAILRDYAEKTQSILSAQILPETLMNRASWPAWAKSVDDVLIDAARLSSLLAQSYPASELLLWKKTLTDIALSVAKAFQEGEGTEGISEAEQAALSRVCAAMEYDL